MGLFKILYFLVKKGKGKGQKKEKRAIHGGPNSPVR